MRIGGQVCLARHNVSRRFRLFFLAAPLDKVRVPEAAVLDNAALCRVIHIDQAEAFAIALGPLKIIQEGPDNVALDGPDIFTPQKPGFGTSTLMDGAERIRQTCWMRVEEGSFSQNLAKEGFP